MTKLDIRQIPVLSDNFIYLAREPDTGCVAVIDPALAEPVLAEAKRLDWRITHILNTHHHPDHVGGNLEIKKATNCTIVGPAHDPDRIPGMDIQVKDGDMYDLGATQMQVFFVPGHTRGHIAYWSKDTAALFCGDTIFSIGCGRLFEGTPQQMWTSLQRLRELPPETRIYCAHEYTEANIRFSLTIDPNNMALLRRAAEVKELRAKGKYSVPSLLGEECAANPFLRADNPELAEAIGMEGKNAVDVFAEIRRRKDIF
ncbi:MAG TPA: hydroxyacylglutathione hydrolase [Rhodospirillaceae bacterium]|nr:hydroxyacylglutathione hydrolase [Candidatus Neomarinimicrobiota bacterium]HCX13866.1 hydroxyacylglutathione hydrolase [Rhodospirillaceae bacterium]